MTFVPLLFEKKWQENFRNRNPQAKRKLALFQRRFHLSNDVEPQGELHADEIAKRRRFTLHTPPAIADCPAKENKTRFRNPAQLILPSFEGRNKKGCLLLSGVAVQRQRGIVTLDHVSPAFTNHLVTAKKRNHGNRQDAKKGEDFE